MSTAKGATWGPDVASMCCGAGVLASDDGSGQFGLGGGWAGQAVLVFGVGGWGACGGEVRFGATGKTGEVRHEIAWGVFIGELQIGVSLGVRRSDTLVHGGGGAVGTPPMSCENVELHVHVHDRPGFQSVFTFFGYFRYGLLRGN